MQFDVEFARSQFPSFRQPELAEWAFFENAGGSYVPHQVADRLDAFFRRYKVQPYGPFAASIVAGEAMDAGYRCIVELLNAAADEVTLGPSTTMNCYVLAQAVRPTLKPGDELIITNQDHEANIGCWERLAEFGVAVKCWAIDPDSGELEVDALRTLVTDRTRLVCFSLCSNIVGTFQDVREIVKVAHDAGRWRSRTVFPTLRTEWWTCGSWEWTSVCSALTRRSARTWASCGESGRCWKAWRPGSFLQQPTASLPIEPHRTAPRGNRSPGWRRRVL